MYAFAFLNWVVDFIYITTLYFSWRKDVPIFLRWGKDIAKSWKGKVVQFMAFFVKSDGTRRNEGNPRRSAECAAAYFVPARADV